MKAGDIEKAVYDTVICSASWEHGVSKKAAQMIALDAAQAAGKFMALYLLQEAKKKRKIDWGKKWEPGLRKEAAIKSALTRLK
ncbi:MAG: hypothetical protein UX91_C0015G0022 [Candidatus Amesbacteria bacterium GW2011_GWB1_47_19]|nr:MAG: hypothetical protein UX91_C0015G0022 [Candidatus Amesbacteria bacterium GW2011_GWB1_47_19]